MFCCSRPDKKTSQSRESRHVETSRKAMAGNFSLDNDEKRAFVPGNS